MDPVIVPFKHKESERKGVKFTKQISDSVRIWSPTPHMNL